MELIKRLKLIETCIGLEEHTLIQVQLPLLKEYSWALDIKNIINLLEKCEYVLALRAIEKYLLSSQAVTLYEDPEISAARLELQQVEEVFNHLLASRSETKMLLDDFHRDYYFNLSDVLEKVNSLRDEISAQKALNYQARYHFLLHDIQCLHEQINAKKVLLIDKDNQLNLIDFISSKYASLLLEYNSLKIEISALEIQREDLRLQLVDEYEKIKEKAAYSSFHETRGEERFENQNNVSEESVLANISPDEKKELKILYRKACKLSHPDIINEEFKDKAHDFMVEINAAYHANDIKGLSAILKNLESGVQFIPAEQIITDKTLLINKLDTLKGSIFDVQSDLERYKASAEYQLLLDIGEDWMDFFQQERMILESTIYDLEKELMDLVSVAPASHDVRAY